MSNLEISQAARLDQYVASLFPAQSRAYAGKLIAGGKVTVNGVAQTKSGYKIRFGDKIVVDHNEADNLIIPEITLEIIYEDDDCVVVSKPLGVLSHSKGAFNPEGTVASWARSHVTGIDGDRAGIVHRLDRATSGVMIVAKNPSALTWLQKQFAQRKVKKTYIAVIEGELPNPEAVIDMPIERNPKKPQTFRVDGNGKNAITNYRTLATTGKYSLLELKPLTGRTHQLRVHLSHLGHPIVGDTFYGGKAADRLYLHAQSLELTLPSRERRTFTVETPPEFAKKVT